MKYYNKYRNLDICIGFIPEIQLNLLNFYNILYSFQLNKNLKRSLRAALDKRWGRMRPAGRQFDMPAVGGWVVGQKNQVKFLLLYFLVFDGN